MTKPKDWYSMSYDQQREWERHEAWELISSHEAEIARLKESNARLLRVVRMVADPLLCKLTPEELRVEAIEAVDNAKFGDSA